MNDINKLYWLRKEKEDLIKRIKENEEKILELSNLGAAPMNSMPKGNIVGNPTEKYVTKLIELNEKRYNMISNITSIELETEEIIKEVDNPEIRIFMRAYYIDGKSWNDIGKKYYRKNCDGSTPRKKVNNYIKNVINKK